LAPLAQIAEAAEGRLKLVGADALVSDDAALLAAHAPGAPWAVVSNLPYNVGAALMLKWLLGPLRPRRLALMFQAEVAERIIAHPGQAAYGRLSVIVQALCRAEIVMRLPARAFTPPPKVDSAVVRLEPLADRPADALLTRLQQLTAAAFGQRRKMLRSSLRSLDGERLCAAAGVDPQARAEDVPVGAYLAMAAAG
jgi:16S rRNA (adenine1518-N6/adenine1519-N6)-dimethyltransferase